MKDIYFDVDWTKNKKFVNKIKRKHHPVIPPGETSKLSTILKWQIIMSYLITQQ